MDFFKKQRVLIIAIVVLVVLNLLTLGTIWIGKGKYRKENRKRHFPREHVFERKLGLSEEQHVAFQSLREEHFESMKPVMEDLRIANLSLMKWLGKEQLDQPAIDSLINQIAVYHKEIEQARFLHFREMRQLCSPGQQKEFDQLIERMSARGYGPRGKRRKMKDKH